MAPSSYFSNMSRYYRPSPYVVKEWQWPMSQLLIWRFVMYGTAGTLVGVFASFIQIQQQLRIAIPWLFPFGVTVGSLTLLSLILGEAALMKKSLIPWHVMLGAFILFVLFLTGFIETAIQLFGSPSNVSGACNTYIASAPSSGVNIETLAWLEQRSICQSWDVVFAFWIVGSILVVWLFVLSIHVNRTSHIHVT